MRNIPYVKTNLGVTDSVISSLKSTGIFKCVKQGLYLASIFIMANTNGHFYLKQNSSIIADGYLSLNGGYQTSTFLQLILLSVNDKLSIQQIHIWRLSFLYINLTTYRMALFRYASRRISNTP